MSLRLFLVKATRALSGGAEKSSGTAPVHPPSLENEKRALTIQRQPKRDGITNAVESQLYSFFTRM